MKTEKALLDTLAKAREDKARAIECQSKARIIEARAMAQAVARIASLLGMEEIEDQAGEVAR